ncbi:MAG: glycosyltransferase [Calditerrivibrio sp.]|nr:glycosyltransferase [Calditerrivibrio sp.]
MRVLHIEVGRNLYGGAKQVVYLLEGLKRMGVENILLTPKGSAISREAKDFSNIVEISFLGDLDLTFPIRLLSVIRDRRPDIVHVHSRKGVDFWGGFVSKLKGVPAICTRRVDNPENPIWAMLKYNFYNKIVTISDGIRRVLLDEKIPPQKIITIRSVLYPEPFRRPATKEEFLKEFGLKGSSKVIGIIAQLIERKGHRYILEILPKLVKENPDIRVVIFGKGKLESKLRAILKEKKLEEYCIFAGFRDDLHKWLYHLDLVVHPADMEGLGVSLIQASAAGVPIVANRVGGIPEIVKDGENGFLVEKGDVESLFNRIMMVLNDEGLARKMGERGIEIVDREFSVDNMVNKYIMLYSEILRGV